MRISLGWQKIKLAWGDGSLTVEIRPLLREASARVATIFEDRETGSGLNAEQRREMQEICAEVFPAHVRSLDELQDEAGEDIPIEQITEEAKLAGLCLEILSNLVLISNLTEEERGNSKGPASAS